MFEAIDEWEDILRLLELQTVLYEHREPTRPMILNNEYYWDEAYTALTELSDEVVYLEAFDSTLYLFRFPELYEFYTLCREQSKLRGINFRKYPAVKEAEKFVEENIQLIHDHTFAWNLWVPKKLIKKRAYTFLIEAGYEFYDYSGLIDTVLTIKEYYAEQCEELRKESAKEKIFKLPPKEEQKAA